MVTSVPCNVHSVVFDKKFSKQRHKDLPGGQGWLVCFHLLNHGHHLKRDIEFEICFEF